MTIACENLGATFIAAPQGQLNSVNSAEAEAELLAHVNGGAHKLALDFGKLDYISSAGLRVVLVLAKRLKQAEGKLVIFGMQPHVREVFDISGFLAILNVVDTREQALAQLA
ncbi:STAS domain-containing protein [Verticiella sediminum]|uniref:Anti-sigma factor antagonist n=1 Tax=Verticiella sediminum TaxID=1247510 RepID=A0A556AGU9_9BURK|nr:STAS domain-containing protein [Verticiella sediminum]TSH92126.1 STAS domain-containing protein [Verticiella sediminum]